MVRLALPAAVTCIGLQEQEQDAPKISEVLSAQLFPDTATQRSVGGLWKLGVMRRRLEGVIDGSSRGGMESVNPAINILS